MDQKSGEFSLAGFAFIFFEKTREKRENLGVMDLFKWLMKFRSDKRMFLSGLIILVAIFTKLES